MDKKKELRIFVEELIKGQVSYPDIGKTLVDWFTWVYSFDLTLMNEIAAMKENNTYNKAYISELKSFLENNFTDITRLKSAESLEGELSRIRFKHGITESLQENSFFVGAKALLAILTTGSTLAFMVYPKFKQWIQNKKAERTKIKTNNQLNLLNYNIIVPILNDILDRIVSGHITSKDQLKREFYTLVDSVSSSDTNVAPYLKSWGV